MLPPPRLLFAPLAMTTISTSALSTTSIVGIMTPLVYQGLQRCNVLICLLNFFVYFYSFHTKTLIGKGIPRQEHKRKLQPFQELPTHLNLLSTKTGLC